MVARNRDDSIFDIMCLLCAIPYLMTIGIGIVVGVRESPGWTSPIFTLLPVALAGLLTAPSIQVRSALVRFCVVACLAIPLAGPLVLYWKIMRGTASAIMPRDEISRDATVIWSAATGLPLRIVAGEQALARTASLESRDRPLAWPAFASGTNWITQDAIDRHGMLVLCPSTDHLCIENALSSGNTINACRMRHSRQFWNLKGPEFETNVYLVPPRGASLNSAVVGRACLATQPLNLVDSRSDKE